MPPCQPYVLVIDDEEEFANTLAERLRLRGHIVEVATSGEAGLACIAAVAPQAVLLDIRMPGLSGIGVLRAIRAGHSGLPVIILTGHCSQEDYDAAQSLGVQGYLSKPLDFAGLYSMLMGVLPQA